MLGLIAAPNPIVKRITKLNDLWPVLPSGLKGSSRVVGRQQDILLGNRDLD